MQAEGYFEFLRVYELNITVHTSFKQWSKPLAQTDGSSNDCRAAKQCQFLGFVMFSDDTIYALFCSIVQFMCPAVIAIPIMKAYSISFSCLWCDHEPKIEIWSLVRSTLGGYCWWILFGPFETPLFHVQYNEATFWTHPITAPQKVSAWPKSIRSLNNLLAAVAAVLQQGLVTTSINYFLLALTIKDNCKHVCFSQTHNQGCMNLCFWQCLGTSEPSVTRRKMSGHWFTLQENQWFFYTKQTEKIK